MTRERSNSPRQKQSLTSKQAGFLGNIRVLLERSNGIPPTLDEMAEFGGVAKGTAAAFVRRLIQKGYLRRTPGKFRSLQLVN
jgi:DNA-binding MarR family transcriptional regulator